MITDDDRRAFARQLEEARHGLHLSIRDLARIVDVPAPTIQGWLSGRHVPVPALRPAYLRMVAALGLDTQLPDSVWGEPLANVRSSLRSGKPPYLGLRQYSTNDRERFFGRDDEVRRLVDVILSLRTDAGHGLMVVLGASGSGKSSLLAAGLLGRACVDGPLSGWTTSTMGVTGTTTRTPDTDLIVVDQFEEFFGMAEPDRVSAAAALAALAERSIVVLGMRADAFAAASIEPLLAGALARPFLIAPLTPEQAREVIVGPAELGGVSVDPDLVTALLDDLVPVGRPDTVAAETLPLLSNALLVTWAAGRGRRMTVSDYVRSGGIWSALEGLAEQAYHELDVSQQEAARVLFLRLVRDSGDLVTRQSLPLDDLDSAGREAMRPFVDARMLTVGDGTVQISHDALLGNWTRLQDWLRNSRADRQVVEQLRRASRVWTDSGRSEDALIPVDRLEVFSEWVADPERQRLLGPRESEFVAASREHFESALAREQQTNRQLRRGRGVAIGLTALASALALVVGGMYLRGLDLQAQTDASRLDAQSRQVALEARSVRADDPNLMTQMSLVAYRQAVTRQSASALLDATSADAPLRWLGKPNAVIAKTSDDQLVARANGSGEVTLWRGDELTRTPGTTFQADLKGGPLYALALARVGARILMAVGGGTAAGLWDVTSTPKLLTDLRELDATVYGASFTGDGSRLALGMSTGVVDLWKVTESGAVAAGSVSIGEGTAAKAVAFSPSSGELFVAGPTNAVARFSSGARPGRLADLTFSLGQANAASQSLGISPDGTQLAVGVAGRQVPRWSLAGAEPRPIAPLTGFTSWTNDVSYSGDGRTLIVANSDKNTYLFEASAGTFTRRLSGSTINTGAEMVGGRPVTSGADGALRVWRPDNPVLRTGSTVYAMSVDASGRFLAASSLYDGQELWDTSGGEPVRLPDPVTGGRSMSSAVAVSPDGSYLVGGSRDGSVLTWPLTAAGAGTAKTIDAFPGSYIGAVAVSPDSTLVAVLQYTGTQVALYRADATHTLSRLATLDTPMPQGVTFSPDGRLLAVPIVGGIVQIWDVSTPSAPTLAGRIEGLNALPTIAAFANHSRTLAIGTEAGEVRLWDVTDPAEPVAKQIFGDPHAAVYGLTFDPDDSTLAAVGGDALVWAWHLDGSTSAYLSLDGSMGNTNDVRFIDGGARLVAGGDDGAIRLWSALPDQARAQLCANRGDILTTDEWARFLPGVTPQDPC